MVLSIESQLGSIPEGKSTKKSIRRNGNLATGGYKRNESATRSDSTYVEADKTEDIVRFLVYDRRSENDQCGLYVYYEAELDENGKYDRSNARILDIYAVSDEGVVVSSERQSWEDVGTEE